MTEKCLVIHELFGNISKRDIMFMSQNLSHILEWNVLNMEYSEIWNIFEYRTFGK